eukprot:SAG22_NODE_913_length_6527_cov_2.919726_7_plen_50_part_00
MKTFDVIGTDPYPINAPYNSSSADGQVRACVCVCMAAVVVGGDVERKGG